MFPWAFEAHNWIIIFYNGCHEFRIYKFMFLAVLILPWSQRLFKPCSSTLNCTDAKYYTYLEIIWHSLCLFFHYSVSRWLYFMTYLHNCNWIFFKRALWVTVSGRLPNDDYLMHIYILFRIETLRTMLMLHSGISVSVSVLVSDS